MLLGNILQLVLIVSGFLTKNGEIFGESFNSQIRQMRIKDGMDRIE